MTSSTDATVHQISYLNPHRLDPLYQQVTGRSLHANAPHRFRQDDGQYNTLWAHERNSLAPDALAELRAYYDDCLRGILPSLDAVALSLLESGAVEPQYVSKHDLVFQSRFRGKDIPDQDDLVASGGRCEKEGMLRRSVTDERRKTRVVTRLILDPRYYYSDSAFIRFDYIGDWGGLATCIQPRLFT